VKCFLFYLVEMETVTIDRYGQSKSTKIESNSGLRQIWYLLLLVKSYKGFLTH